MLAHWFVPDDKAAIRPERISKNALWHHVTFIQDLERMCHAGDLLLISFDPQVSQRIKRNLYQFNHVSSRSLQIVDCGHLGQGQYEAILPVWEDIRKSGAMVMVLGAPLGFMRFQIEDSRMVSILRESNLDDDIHLREGAAAILYQYIGTQRHLVAESQHNVEGHLRLSELREDLSLAEPCIRDSSAMIFHGDCMSAAEAGYMTGMSGSGLTVTEACQLFRYAGAAQSLYSVGIYGYDLESDREGMMANAIAQMIWYLLEGSTLREDPEKSDLTRYTVQARDHEYAFVFYKSELSGRWWIEDREGRKLACSYKDYKKACEEDYSERIIRAVLG